MKTDDLLFHQQPKCVWHKKSHASPLKTKTARTPKRKPASKPRARSKPREYYHGRPVYTDEDRKHMKPNLPPETEWVKELLGE